MSHGGHTLEMHERRGDVADFECDECGEQFTLPVDEDGRLIDQGKDGPTA
jgi:hypothetical protein